VARRPERRKYGDPIGLVLTFAGPVFEWRGPAPYHFVAVPPEECEELGEVAAEVTYGWGMVPVRVTLGDSEWETALWPREGGYVVPLRDWVREDEGVELGQVVEVRLDVVARA
jgi:hypothetical protein